ncbi:NAD(P)-binding domain-containing protein [Parvibaculum sp.]|uniref:flavin-containing monooxygenase n=1 Tax=Parvibaculum sp. TaxID=2024848 RepID=UPI001B13470F|nr:NAD(P)-binding domain-containing protein [Parvibaculum sp.]MBO6633289.1 NAD(P)-binding domain-containing protein [Parvibaculum sp.]MBO6678326.1 NAD(P)-binding domain-containing protein [Parvibaculum sp.]MBO6685306.1 NAD(P)-binding domain-containing protein [Parvibaculum sp.]MBO6904662.1 NAD(P)-binding domain-containing protein [Parvibaculum sp.]
MAEIGRVCVVGGGPAGLSLARTFLRHGIPFDVYERHSDVGGLWDQSNPGSPVYDSAHFISSKTQSHYHDFPMPDDYPDYPSNRQIHGYMRLFADAYGLRDHIRFNTSVEKAELQADGSWQVRLSTGETKQYGSLVCANGTNWHPVMPDYPGSFTGEMRHAVTFRSMDEFRGKRVLVIGAGNSGCDIACDAAKGADAAFISLRRGYHFLPKHLFGIPADVVAHEGPHLPMWLTQRIFGVILRILNGDLTRLGLQKPDHKLFETHPILNTQLLHYLGHGDIKAKPDVERFEGKTVHFKDGTSEEIDLVLCATGYTWKVPYVDPSVFTWKSGKPDLYMNLFSREHPTLYALGFMETNGGAYKLFDEMADMIARAIMVRAKGRTGAAQLDKLIATDKPDLTGGIKFVGSARHATYVEIDAYRKHMGKLRKHFGWPGLDDGCFDALLKQVPARKAA